MPKRTLSFCLAMTKPYRVLRIAHWALLVLAYGFSALNLVLAGVIPLVFGGEPIPILADGTAIPARLFGLLSILISAPLSFLLFYVPSGVIRLLLDLSDAKARPPAA